jgi:zinc protease
MKSVTNGLLSSLANYKGQIANLALCLCVSLASVYASAMTGQATEAGANQTPPQEQAKPTPLQEQAKKQKQTKKDKKKAAYTGPRMIFVSSASPLYTVEIMVMAGSVDDPSGKEGLANLVARALVEGGLGGSKNPAPTDKQAEIRRSWGSTALPTVRVDKQTTTFSVTVPQKAFADFINTALTPMFSQPSFSQGELDRLRSETLAAIQSRLRFEQQESLGLEALESYIFQGTPLSPLSIGTVRGLQAIQREDLLNFYKVFYTVKDVVIATNAKPEFAPLLASIFPSGSRVPQQMCGCDVYLPPGRQVLIITQPNATATGIQLGFPIDAKRNQPDYWPLFIANTYFGAHRDDFGRLFQEISASRGYTSGAYSYIEYLGDRPYSKLPPPSAPRSEQYFSIWIRPVANQYAHFVLKAATAELHRFIVEGLTAEQVEEAKVKARSFYADYAANVNRQLGYRLDDTFYGTLKHGYLTEMVKDIDAVTLEQVNAAIRRNLQVGALRYVITTSETFAAQLADDIANDKNCTPKSLAEYNISEPVPPDKQAMLTQDRRWIEYPLNIKSSDIHIVKSEQLFETAEFPDMGKTVEAGVQK